MTGERHGEKAGWWAVADIAGAQHGVVSRDQLRRVGFGDGAIDHALATGRLHRVFRGAFGVGHGAVGWRGHMIAAVLACGEGSVVSHGTAAFLWGLWERQPREIDVIAPIQAGRKVPGIRRRHTPSPLPRDAWSHESIPCTSPSRTIVDIAGIVGEAALRRTIEQAAVHSVLDVARIDEILTGPRRRGSRRLRLVLADWRRYPRQTRVRSVMEAKLLPLLTAHGIVAPECNVDIWIEGERFEVDFLWRDQRLAVETDGGKYHRNPQARARDRRRDRALPAAGYRIWRLTWDDLEERPGATMRKLAHLLRPPSSTVPYRGHVGQRNSGA